MKKFKLIADSWSDESHPSLPKSFDTVTEALQYAQLFKCVHESYLSQHEDDGDDIRISMQEISDMYEIGEIIDDLNFF